MTESELLGSPAINFRPTDIRVAWDSIKAQVAEILGGDSERPEEVYAECRYGKAYLYTCDHGFVVLKQYLRSDTQRPEVLVWLAYGDGLNLTALYTPHLENLARKVGAETLVFRTRRKGFSRVLGPRWQLRAIEYELRIDNGK